MFWLGSSGNPDRNGRIGCVQCTFGAKSGSLLNLKDSTCSLCFLQIRSTVVIVVESVHAQKNPAPPLPTEGHQFFAI
jgi:hypothetical protein